LEEGGYLRRSDAAVLREGYSFLRRLEQRMVILRGPGPSYLSDRDPGLPRLARSVGIQEVDDQRAARALWDRYVAVTRDIRSVYSRIMGGP
jgi:glutamate-ammonia-ligase adenylyltransferase